MHQSTSVTPDLVTYSTLGKAYVDHGHISAALRLLEQMERWNSKPDALLLHMIAGVCCTNSSQQPAHVLDVFQRLTRHGLVYNNTTVSVVVKAFIRADAWTEALSFLVSVPSKLGIAPDCRVFAPPAKRQAKGASPVERELQGLATIWLKDEGEIDNEAE